jgi:DnaJ-class molecular chaperone
MGGGGFRPPPGGGFGGAEEVDLSDHFEGLFGGAQQRRGGGGGFGGFGGGSRKAPPAKGADIAYRLPVPFEDAAALREQRVTLQGGKTISIKLPKGVEEGAKIRLAGQGHPGPGGNGDAIVTISIQPHRFFTRDGDNIRLDLPVSLDEALLGAKVKVPTVDGAVMLSVPKGSSSGKTLRLKGKGFTGKDGQRGDQLVTLMVDVPGDDPELQRFVEGWSRKGRGNPRASLGV